ncbi:HAD family hydrolase [Candidatus Uhrbacteria bacterium]|nr:HAD family hydrolase [Candidatus Uhrbacteria bacterium]
MRLVQRPNRYLILFDLDGTLYSFRGGSYRRSALRRRVRLNAGRFLMNRLGVTLARARRILGDIERTYGEDVSIGVERRFSINRREYFRAVWNIPARGYVTVSPNLRRTIQHIRRQFDVAVLSDAPSIWVHRVLRTLRIADLFRGRTFTGEGDDRKSFGNAFQRLIVRHHLNPRRCIVVGDQARTDIIPARAAGMQTILLSRHRRSTRGDENIRTIGELESALEHLTSTVRTPRTSHS